MNIVLDAGALIGIDRGDRRTAGLLKLGRRADAQLLTSASVIGRAWRDGTRQARLARALPMIAVRPVDLDSAKRAGELLGDSGSADVVDALLALLAMPGDQVVTSDPGDIKNLLEARGIAATVLTV